MVELKKITKSFGKKTVIRNLDLSIGAGERLALISPSGSGKTTLFRIIAGLEKSFGGECTVGGRVALMFQEDRLFPNATVLDNVTAVAEGKEAEAKELLIKLGLDNTLDMLPRELSGGMRRRVALARALLFDGEVVLLDECFTGLDGDTKKGCAEVINEYTEGKTLLLITHDKEDATLLDCSIKTYENGFLN